MGTRSPGNSEAPVATKAPSWIRAPLTWAWGPIRTSSPTDTGWSARARSSACSITTHLAPISTLPSSAVTTAFHRTRESGPTWTSPTSTAVGATQALGSTVGCARRCSTSTAPRLMPERERRPLALHPPRPLEQAASGEGGHHLIGLLGQEAGSDQGVGRRVGKALGDGQEQRPQEIGEDGGGGGRRVGAQVDPPRLDLDAIGGCVGPCGLHRQ